jgi:hypothetical protein
MFVWRGEMGMRVAFCGHALLCGLPFVSALALRSRPAAFSAYLQLALWTAIAGPLGTPVAIFAVAFGEVQVPSAQDIGAWLDDQVAPWLGKTRDLQSALLDQRLRIEGASRAKPLRQAFAGGSQKEKFAALTVIAGNFEPSLAYALRLAMRDSDPSVRVLASTVTTKLQTDMSTRLVELKGHAEKDDTPEALLALGEAHAGYAASGLLSASQAQQHLDLAIRHIGTALARLPKSDVVRQLYEAVVAERRQNARTLEPAAAEQLSTAAPEVEESGATPIPMQRNAGRTCGAQS